MLILYQATCYLPAWVLLVLLVAYVPALALFPRLIQAPLAFSAIPIISVLVVNTISAVLLYFNVYTHNVVVMITIMLALLAAVRVYQYKQPVLWQRIDFHLIFFNICLLLPLLALCGLSSFMSDDALASWHYWAMHFYQGKMPDTMGYPPFFSLWLSYCYQLLGTSEYQGAVKALLCVLPFTLLNSLAFIQPQPRKYLLHIILSLVCVLPGFLSFKFYNFYSVGYADPLLAASIAISAALLLYYLQQRGKYCYLWLCVLTAITASLSKQPGLLWVLFSLPVIFIVFWIKHQRIDKIECGAIIVAMLPAVIWLLGPGAHFYHNQGVIGASLHNAPLNISSMLITLGHSLIQYLIKQPSLLLLFLLATVFSWRTLASRLVFLSFVVPALLLWFIFGAYHMRLGLHVIIVSGLLIAAESRVEKYLPQAIENHITRYINRWQYGMLLLASVGFMVLSIILQTNPHLNVPGRIYPLQAGRSNIYHYFGSAAETVYQQLYHNSQIKIWTPNRYIEGIFYGHTPVITRLETGGAGGILGSGADYVILSGRVLPESYAGFTQLLRQQPQAFTEIPITNSLYHYQIYRINR